MYKDTKGNRYKVVCFNGAEYSRHRLYRRAEAAAAKLNRAWQRDGDSCGARPSKYRVAFIGDHFRRDLGRWVA